MLGSLHKYIGSKFRDSFSFYYVGMFEGVVSSGAKKNKVTGERRCESVWSSPQPELALGRKERDLSNHRDVGEGCLMSRLTLCFYTIILDMGVWDLCDFRFGCDRLERRPGPGWI